MTHEFLTVAAEIRHEIDPIKGSRFLTTAAQVASAEEAEAFVERIRTEFANASHNCWAWRVGAEGKLFRSSDDGEPSGSAGRPILAQIEGHELTNTAVVVTRWFGGTKLGVGGLVRAYGGAAGKTLDRAEIATVVIKRRLVVVHPYDCSGTVEGLLSAHGLAPVQADYGADVELVLEVPEKSADAFVAELTERTAGRASATTS